VAEGGHEPLLRALSADGHDVSARLPAEALGPNPDVIVVVRADPAAAVLAALERRARLPVAPVIVLSGAAPAKVRASLLRAGAHTCLQDPVDPGELLAAVSGALAVKRARDAEPEAEGVSDPVTGLGNRRLGERELDLFVARATRHGHALSLVDGVGVLPLVGGSVWLHAGLWRRRARVWRWAAARPGAASGMAFAAGLGLGLLLASAFSAFFWWWAVGGFLFAAANAAAVAIARGRDRARGG